jgi:hypothetical protein
MKGGEIALPTWVHCHVAKSNWSSRGIHEQLGLRTGMLLTEVPQELTEP